ncbi:helix-turn-helix domain-containing protein [Nonomuraea sp. NPDC046802]|uniref:TetR/AcrR family transcriptional regulator n=1 Tax=Nonomuraea sp. NPDC046802 TaxID=3154919 RepID=UPI0033D2A974
MMRERLLAAAKQCLADKGYARTTVRDIVAASGSNLAAINYHFRSKDALLYEAMLELTSEAMDEVTKALPGAEDVPSGGEPAPSRPELFWTELIRSLTHNHTLWAVSVEIAAQAVHSPDLRKQLSASRLTARGNLAAVLHHGDGHRDAVGGVHLALMTGLLVQWMIDPANAPTAQDITEGILALADDLRTVPH